MKEEVTKKLISDYDNKKNNTTSVYLQTVQLIRTIKKNQFLIVSDLVILKKMYSFVKKA